MKTCVEYRSNQNLKAPKNPAPKANANGAVDGGKGGGKKGGGKGGGKSDKSEKCKKCGKANHKAADCWSDKTCTWESCFSNPKSASYKPPSNLSNAAAGVTPAQPTGLDAAAILSVLMKGSSSSGSGPPALANAAPQPQVQISPQ